MYTFGFKLGKNDVYFEMYEYIKNDYYILVLSKISIQYDFSIVSILDLPPWFRHTLPPAPCEAGGEGLTLA